MAVSAQAAELMRSITVPAKPAMNPSRKCGIGVFMTTTMSTALRQSFIVPPSATAWETRFSLSNSIRGGVTPSAVSVRPSAVMKHSMPAHWQ